MLVYLTVATLPSSTAHASYVANLCCQLGGRVPMRLIGCAPSDGATTETLREFWNLSFDRVEVRLWPVVSTRWNGSHARAMSMAQQMLWRRDWIGEHDVLITHNALTAAAARMRGIPFVYDMHAISPRSRVLTWATMGSTLLGVIYNSPGMQREWERRTPHPPVTTCVSPNAVREELFANMPDRESARASLCLPADRLTVTYVGSMGCDRGVDLMLEAARRVGGRTQQRVLWLFVGGEASQIEDWRRVARDHRLEPDTYFFAGFRPQSELPLWYAASDILCAPYGTRVSTRDVMSPMKLFEYLAAGRVIVAPDIPAVCDVVGHGDEAYLVEPDSAGAIAEAVLTIEREPRRFAGMAESARARGMRATWKNKSEDLLRWLRTLGGSEPADDVTAFRSATG